MFGGVTSVANILRHFYRHERPVQGFTSRTKTFRSTVVYNGKWGGGGAQGIGGNFENGLIFDGDTR